MFGLDADDSNADDVQQAQVFSAGDHCIGPDGAEWRISEPHGRVFGEDYIRIERVSDHSEERGVPCGTFYREYEVQ